MVPNRWYTILESADLKREPVGVKRLGERLVLWRDEAGRAVGMPDRCSHRGAALSQGRVVEGCIECPYHGFLFDAGGHCRLIPANGKDAPVPRGFDLDTLPLREEHGFIWLWWTGEPFRGDVEDLPPLPWFDNAPTDLSQAATLTMEWEVSFGRAMESQMDMHHFPFLHRKVSGETGPLMDPFEATIDGDMIRFRGQLRHDDGKSAEDSPGMAFDVYVHFPGMVLMRLTRSIVLLGATCPVDEDHTWIAARYYLERPRWPVIGPALAKFIAWWEGRAVWEDDHRAILAIKPKHTGVGVNVPIAADAAIVLWLKRYEEARREGAADGASK